VVSLDGRDITSAGTISTGSGGARNWMLRDCYLGIPGTRIVSATAAGKSGVKEIVGRGQSAVDVRFWTEASGGTSGAKAHDSAVDLDRLARRGPGGEPGDAPEGTLVTDRERAGERAGGARSALADPSQRRARNVILLIGDGMGVAHRTAARVLSRGYSGGKSNGTLAMDRFPFNGMLMTSSLDSLVTDSAPGAHAYSTGNKTNNGMEGVFPDNTAAEDDNPRIENLPEWITRNFGMVTGIVSDAHLTDATPAAMVAHTQNRGNGTLIASQFYDLLPKSNLKVLMGGGRAYFIPKSRAGSLRSDERDVLREFVVAGFQLVETRSQLRSVGALPGTKLLGLFAPGGMNVAFDKLRLGDPDLVASNPDQPFLDEMAAVAIGVLSRYPEGFFLMVEGAHIDKQAHGMDAERSIYDVIQFDKAVGVALDFATRTNSDADPDNDTLVVVGADHETAGLALPGVSRPEAKWARDYVKTYGYGAARNDSTRFNFTNYADANHDAYPDDPDPDYKLIMSFGANSDRYEDWQSNARPKAPTRRVNGLSVANPDAPDRYSPGGFLVTGVLENGDRGGGADGAVHTMVDVPVAAYGPGASQFGKISDNTEAFFNIVNSILGRYPTPQF
jgi:alkaline phosphatase